MIFETITTCAICAANEFIQFKRIIPVKTDICHDSDRSIFLCFSCIAIKAIIDNHISQTSGEYHMVNSELVFIELFEYWSDWAIDFNHTKKNKKINNNFNMLKIWNTFSYANQLYNFHSKEDALCAMLDYRKEYKDLFGVITFSSYEAVLKNVSMALLDDNKHKAIKKMSYVNIALHNNVSVSDWLSHEAVERFLKNTSKLF
jgi:hypothetical protein